MIDLYPFAWIQLEVDWEVFDGRFDYVTTGGLPGPDEWKHFTFWKDTVLPEGTGNRQNCLNLYGYKAGQEKVRFQNDSLYCAGFDTTYHEIIY